MKSFHNLSTHHGTTLTSPVNDSKEQNDQNQTSNKQEQPSSNPYSIKEETRNQSSDIDNEDQPHNDEEYQEVPEEEQNEMEPRVDIHITVDQNMEREYMESTKQLVLLKNKRDFIQQSLNKGFSKCLEYCFGEDTEMGQRAFYRASPSLNERECMKDCSLLVSGAIWKNLNKR